MIYLLTTKYKMGIYFSKYKASAQAEKAKGRLEEFETWDETITELKKRETGWDYPLVWDDFMPNRLYQIKEDRIYTVVYSRYSIGFVCTENLQKFLEEHNFRHYRLETHMCYGEALQRVNQLGAVTRRSNLGDWESPRCGKVYKRFL